MSEFNLEEVELGSRAYDALVEENMSKRLTRGVISIRAREAGYAPAPRKATPPTVVYGDWGRGKVAKAGTQKRDFKAEAQAAQLVGELVERDGDPDDRVWEVTGYYETPSLTGFVEAEQIWPESRSEGGGTKWVLRASEMKVIHTTYVKAEVVKS